MLVFCTLSNSVIDTLVIGSGKKFANGSLGQHIGVLDYKHSRLCLVVILEPFPYISF